MANKAEVIMMGRTGDDQWHPVGIDLTTFAVNMVDYAHHEIHAGSHYFIKNYQLLDATTDLLDITFMTPDTAKLSHYRVDIGGLGGTVWTLFEDAVFSTDGADVTPLNNYRDSTNTSGMLVQTGATMTTDGAQIEAGTFGGAAIGGRSVGGGSAREDEIILKRNTGYLLRFETETTGNNLDYRIAWYEHTNRS